MKANGPNVNHSAVKRKLDQRKVLRAKINANQVQAYKKLLEYIEGRKAPNAWKNSGP